MPERDSQTGPFAKPRGPTHQMTAPVPAAICSISPARSFSWSQVSPSVVCWASAASTDAQNRLWTSFTQIWSHWTEQQHESDWQMATATVSSTLVVHEAPPISGASAPPTEHTLWASGQNGFCGGGGAGQLISLHTQIFAVPVGIMKSPMMSPASWQSCFVFMSPASFAASIVPTAAQNPGLPLDSVQTMSSS